MDSAAAEAGIQASVVVEAVAETSEAAAETSEAAVEILEVVETSEVGEVTVASTAAEVGVVVGVVVLGNRGGPSSRFPILFSLQSHLNHSVYAENVPANFDVRVTDNSQDNLIKEMQNLAIKPTDLPLRPDFGTVGKAFKMRTNFFPIKLPKMTIFEYDVAITPSTTIRRVKRRIFELAEATNDWTQHLKGKVAHDYSSKLVAVKRLPDPLVIKIIFKDEDEDTKDKDAKDKKKQKPKEYTLTFKLVKDLDTSNLLEYVYFHFPVNPITSRYFKLSRRGRSSLRGSANHLCP